ncbi:hypothetical protein L0U85_13700 [Glycomyces sp. L485]|uniref:hypothetical protein n=1 Tax=Glycomyces sp. L485 TaxID=2909235 RepID=UPI001F4A140F|nr:hypothetical protein [Glycomyces sp. L485]MCH7231898.1 hypothetical protein [Glycomyces sp. L485]
MFVSSLLILVTAAVLLTIGLTSGNDQLLFSSIAASLAAGVALYMGARSRPPRPRVPRHRPAADDAPRRPAADDTRQLTRIGVDDRPTREIPVVAGRVFEPTDYAVDREPEIRFETPPRRAAGGSHAASGPLELRDEPIEQHMTSVEAAALMRLDAEVAVVDGRPRFHHANCVHLVGRDFEPLAVAEAVGLGFTPCALCEPASRLLMAPAGR